jgi:hypothetical protein
MQIGCTGSRGAGAAESPSVPSAAAGLSTKPAVSAERSGDASLAAPPVQSRCTRSGLANRIAAASAGGRAEAAASPIGGCISAIWMLLVGWIADGLRFAAVARQRGVRAVLDVICDADLRSTAISTIAAFNPERAFQGVGRQQELGGAAPVSRMHNPW